MFFFTFPIIWSFAYFFYIFYILIIFSCILYFLPAIGVLVKNGLLKKNESFYYQTGFDFYWIFGTFLFFIFFANYTWSSPTLTSWFGNILFSSFQLKISYLIVFFFYCVLLVFSTSFYFSSKELYDFVIVSFNFFYWILFLFTSNNLFTFIFFIEILSTLVFLILITSTFSTTYFYNNLDLNLNNYFANNLPFFYLQTLIFFFWISLITSLNLFLFLILFYLKFLTLDWFVLEYVFFYLVTLNESKNTTFLIFIWFNLLFCLLLKCGLVPFYFWKPIFFKGVPLHVLFFYIFFFYFFLFLFIIYFLTTYVNELFFFFIFVNALLLMIGIFILFFILCEAFYLKSFFALSSIINTLFVMLALNGTVVSSILFLI